MIVFSDIDGTLLNDNHVVLESTRSSIKELQDKDITFVIVSARSPSGIYPILKENDFNCHIISYSGGLILDRDGQILYSKGMDKSVAGQVIRHIEANEMDCSWNIYSYDRWIVKDNKDPRVVREENIVHALSESGSMESLMTEDVVHKILCMCNPDRILSIEAELKDQFPHLSIVKSSHILLEIMEHGVNKGDAVQLICDILGENREDTIAFGDNYNDEEMLRRVAKPYLMGNAPTTLKEMFPSVTEDNNSDGIYHALVREGIL